MDLQSNTRGVPPGDVLSAAVSKDGSSTSHGMLDTGATCSAGPETSIKNHISAVLQQDRAAHITIDGKRRPRFRYGSGKWGKALYRVSISSNLTNNAFHAFALPDPEESREPWFVPSMLVPVLLGMDFIKGNGLVIDFNDGLAVYSKQREAKPFFLDSNSKSHYLIDVVHFLTSGKKNLQGAAQVHVLTDDGNDVNSVDLHTLTFDDLFAIDSSFSSLRQSRETSSTETHMSSSFLQLWKRRLSIESQSGLMGNLPISNPLSSTSSSRCEHGSEAQGNRQSGQPSLDGDGPQRSSLKGRSMAVLRRTQRVKFHEQQVGGLEDMSVLRSTSDLRSQGGSTSFGNQAGQRPDDAEGLGGTSSCTTRRHVSGREPGQDNDGEGHCRDQDENTASGVPEAMVDGSGEDLEGETGCETSGSWFKQFRSRRISKADSQGFVLRLPMTCHPIKGMDDFVAVLHDLLNSKPPPLYATAHIRLVRRSCKKWQWEQPALMPRRKSRFARLLHSLLPHRFPMHHPGRQRWCRKITLSHLPAPVVHPSGLSSYWVQFQHLLARRQGHHAALLPFDELASAQVLPCSSSGHRS